MATAPTAPTTPQRHALGLPAGSVRALLALGVLGYLWLLVYLLSTWPLEDDKFLPLRQAASLSFLYMQFLMVLILAHFFSAHGHTIGRQVSRRSPLGLPRGSLRILLLVGYVGLAVWSYQHREAFKLPEHPPLILMMLVLIVSYAIGYVLSGAMRFLSGGKLPPWFQDVQAWIALIGLMLFGVVLLVRLVINKGIPLEDQIGLEMIEAVLAGIVGFYFGSRS